MEHFQCLRLCANESNKFSGNMQVASEPRKSKQSWDSDEDDSEEEEFHPARRGNKKPAKVSFDSDEDSESELFKLDNQRGMY